MCRMLEVITWDYLLQTTGRSSMKPYLKWSSAFFSFMACFFSLTTVQAATQKGNPDRYDTETRGYEVGEEQEDGSVSSSIPIEQQ
jgi:hypothetical protein